jgi:hypothetical protein
MTERMGRRLESLLESFSAVTPLPESPPLLSYCFPIEIVACFVCFTNREKLKTK